MITQRNGWLLLTILAGLFLVVSMSNQADQAAGEPVTILDKTVPPVPTLDSEQIENGEALYIAFCASCHGNNLEGATNWRETQPDGSLLPPPHDSSGHTWHHADELLIEIISEGGDPSAYKTNMPGFGDQLDKDEIEAVLSLIKSYWGREEREFQWWITASEE